MAIIDTTREARHEVIEKLRDRGVAENDCIIKSVSDLFLGEGWVRVVALNKKSMVRVAESFPFRQLVTGSFL